MLHRIVLLLVTLRGIVFKQIIQNSASSDEDCDDGDAFFLPRLAGGLAVAVFARFAAAFGSCFIAFFSATTYSLKFYLNADKNHENFNYMHQKQFKMALKIICHHNGDNFTIFRHPKIWSVGGPMKWLVGGQ